MPVPPSPVKVNPVPKETTPVKEQTVLVEEEPKPKVAAKVVGVQKYKRKATSTLSISGLQNQKKEEQSEDEQEDLSNKPREVFTLEELNSKWKSYCYKMKQQGRQGLYVTLSKGTPVLKENFTVEFEVDNEVQNMELESERSDLLAFLRNELNNFGISLVITLTEKDDSTRRLTSREKFLKMAENNEALHKLRERLNLDIEY